LKINLKLKPSSLKVFVIIFSFLILGPLAFFPAVFAPTIVSVSDTISDFTDNAAMSCSGPCTPTGFETDVISDFTDSAAVSSTSSQASTVTFDADSAAVSSTSSQTDLVTFDADSAAVSSTSSQASTVTFDADSATVGYATSQTDLVTFDADSAAVSSTSSQASTVTFDADSAAVGYATSQTDLVTFDADSAVVTTALAATDLVTFDADSAAVSSTSSQTDLVTFDADSATVSSTSSQASTVTFDADSATVIIALAATDLVTFDADSAAVSSTSSQASTVTFDADSAAVSSTSSQTDLVTFDADSAVVTVASTTILNPTDTVTFDADSATVGYIVSDTTTTLTIQSSVPTIQITSSASSLDTVTVPTGVEVQIDYTNLAGVNTITTPAGQDLTITSGVTGIGNVQVTIEGGATITGTGWNKILDLPRATITTIPTIGIPAGEEVKKILELGFGDIELTFTNDLPVRILIPDAGSLNPFYSRSGTLTPVTDDCGLTDFATATLADTYLDSIPVTECAFGSGIDLIFWTSHFTGFGGTGATAGGGGGGGGGGGDQTAPSLSIGFTENEFPIIFDGVKYKHYELDKVHTMMAETGKQVEFTVLVYENNGPQNVQHVQMYVNQFGTVIRGDLTETMIIYDGRSGIEIRDPYDLISSASVIPSRVGNKAEFTFVIVFEKEIPLSDIIFDLWDTSRNSMKLHLKHVLMVLVPEVPGVPEETPEAEVPTMNWTRQLTVLKKWGGFHIESASDIDVLSEFGIKGEKIPPYFKRVVKWILQDQISQEEFVNALLFLKSEGIFPTHPEQSKSKATIPDWIRNNAKWWSDGQIGDSDFVSGIQFMIKEKIINIPNLPEQASETAEEKVPDWIRNNAGWWANGLISEDDFVSGMKWLVENGIIKV